MQINVELIKRSDITSEEFITKLWQAVIRIYSYDDVKRVGLLTNTELWSFSLSEIYKLLGVV